MRGKIDNYIQQVFQPTFDSNSLTPVLLYITKQEFGGKKRDRPMHSHQSLCEILLVYRGFGYYTVGKQCYSIQAGDILFYNQGELHEVRSMSDAEIGTYCIGLTGLQMPGLPGNHIIPQGSAPVRDSGARFSFLLQMCEQAYQLLERDVYAKAAAQCLAASFVLLACQIETEQMQQLYSEQDNEIAGRIRDYIDQHFTEPLTLKIIAVEFRCSEAYVSHVFKKITGFSPIQYVIRRRIGMAQTYLISSDYTAAQIATLVGYDNTNYFNTIFTKVVGLPPIRYKKQYLEALRGNIVQ